MLDFNTINGQFWLVNVARGAAFALGGLFIFIAINGMMKKHKGLRKMTKHPFK